MCVGFNSVYTIYLSYIYLSSNCTLNDIFICIFPLYTHTHTFEYLNWTCIIPSINLQTLRIYIYVVVPLVSNYRSNISKSDIGNQVGYTGFMSAALLVASEHGELRENGKWTWTHRELKYLCVKDSNRIK